jgi:hypothetical protein
MSSDDSNAIQSGRQSSDGTLSEQATASDGAQTNMTSVMDTDEEMGDSSSLEGVARAPRAVTEDDGDNDGHDRHSQHDADVLSLYPSSHYPQVPSPHRMERPYSSVEPEGTVVGAEV